MKPSKRKQPSSSGKVFALVPALRKTRTRGAPIAPKVGGHPDAASAPLCRSCGATMAFLFQLPAVKGKIDLGRHSAVSVFQCENPDSFCDRAFAGSGANAAVPGLRQQAAVARAATKPAYREKPIKLVAASEDAGSLAIDTNTAGEEALAAYAKARKKAPSSKVGGLPIWLQGPDVPECCGEPTRYVGQLASKPWRLRFGDGGTGYLFRCDGGCDEPFKFFQQSY